MCMTIKWRNVSGSVRPPNALCCVKTVNYFKMEDLLKLAVFSIFMFLGSYLAGSVPLAFSLSEVSENSLCCFHLCLLCASICSCLPSPTQNRLRLVSSFGAGLLVGAALIVIIPEGVELLVESGEFAWTTVLWY